MASSFWETRHSSHYAGLPIVAYDGTPIKVESLDPEYGSDSHNPSPPREDSFVSEHSKTRIPSSCDYDPSYCLWSTAESTSNQKRARDSTPIKREHSPTNLTSPYGTLTLLRFEHSPEDMSTCVESIETADFDIKYDIISPAAKRVKLEHSPRLKLASTPPLFDPVIVNMSSTSRSPQPLSYSPPATPTPAPKRPNNQKPFPHVRGESQRKRKWSRLDVKPETRTRPVLKEEQKPAGDVDDDKDVYDVEAILSSSTNPFDSDGPRSFKTSTYCVTGAGEQTLYYFVLWRGYPYPNWEPVSNVLPGCTGLVEKFHAENPEMPRLKLRIVEDFEKVEKDKGAEDAGGRMREGGRKKQRKLKACRMSAPSEKLVSKERERALESSDRER